MHDPIAIPEPSQIMIADTVSFSYQGRDLTGTVVKKGRTTAHVVCDDQRYWGATAQKTRLRTRSAT